MTPINPELKTLIIGYGNPGRQDDGLGPAFIEGLLHRQALNTPLSNIHSQTNYQLTVEDALEINHYEQVIFVDASLECLAPIHFEEITTTHDTGFGSHSMTPHAVIQLSHDLYQHKPNAYILGIRGYEFDQFEEKLSGQASANLQQALTFLLGQWHA